ncbi:MAG TPA: beta galactosidase jelly roll domain-containing protein, partial [bacterium]|nr:beta galactosidase jelly roll domain-containing protein [bacterium]
MRAITSLSRKNKVIVYSVVIVLGFLHSASLHAEETINLSGTWRFRYDPIEYGEQKGWQEPGEITWSPMQVPMSYNAGSESWYSGIGWYRTSFRVPAGWSGGHLFLRFLGVNIRCKIWVNGELVGEHRYPYLPFEIDVTGAVKPGGNNWLVVKADNRIQDQAVPDTNWDGWWNFGG